MNYLSNPDPISPEELENNPVLDLFLGIDSLAPFGKRLKCTIANIDKENMRCSIRISSVWAGDGSSQIIGEYGEQYENYEEDNVPISKLFKW